MNITDLYSTRIQNDFDEDHAEIVAILKANPKAKLKLINYYRGMQLSYPAAIVSVDNGILDLDIQAEQAFTIEQGRYIFIRSNLFRYDVFARVQYINTKKKAASFVKFCYVELMAERRNTLRIEPDKPIDVAVGPPGGSIEACINDISLSGLSISIPNICQLEIGAEAPISFRLYNHEQENYLNVNITARLINIKGDSSPYSYIFAINPDRLLESQISKYLFQRQVEIIREIKDAIL